MGAIRIVVYAEGPAESGQSSGTVFPPAPGSRLREDELGAAHFLVRHCIDEGTDHPAGATEFDAPLRYRGRQVRGSDLQHEQPLRQLLTWPDPERAPDLAIVMIDADGEPDRKERLSRIVADLSARVERVLAVSIQEFEAWLIADITAVNDVLNSSFDEVENPEAMEPGRAKEQFEQWVHDRADDIDIREARRGIARSLRLQRVADRCNAFQTFLGDLETAIENIET